jgi:hypothetical protein
MGFQMITYIFVSLLGRAEAARWTYYFSADTEERPTRGEKDLKVMQKLDYFVEFVPFHTKFYSFKKCNHNLVSN